MAWEVKYLESVTDWLDSLTDEQLESLARLMKLLKLCGNNLKMPHSKPVGDKIFELREKRFGLRVYYMYMKKEVILMIHAGDKDSQKKDILVAKKLIKNLKSSIE
jgi:putative addiction module killer protein